MANLFSTISSNLGTISKPFGPQADGQFSEWLVLSGVDPSLRSPCDTQVWVVEDPSGTKYLLLKIWWPQPLRKDPIFINLLSEFPSYFVLKYDDLDYVGVDHSLYPDYLAEQPRSFLFDPANPPPLESISSRVLDGKVARFFESGAPIGTLKPGVNLTIKLLTSLRIDSQGSGLGQSQWSQIARRNLMDPAAFLAVLWTYALNTGKGLKTEEDISTLSSWMDINSSASNGAIDRIIVEVRDEHNTPISSTSDIASRISIQSQPLPLTRATGSAAHYAYLLAEGLSTELSLDTVRNSPPPVLPSLEEDVIFFDFLSGQSITGRTTSTIYLSSHQHIVIQAYRPATWFAAQQASSSLEFRSANTQAAKPIERYTQGNEVELLIDGVQYFRDLEYEVKKVDSSSVLDFFHISAWSMNIDFHLLSHPRYSTTSKTLRQLLQNKLSRVRALIFDNPIDIGPIDIGPIDIGPIEIGPIVIGPYLYDTDVPVKFLNNGASQLRVVHDGRQVSLSSAAHMKIVVVNSTINPGLVAYCGGIDVGDDRVTDWRHREAEEKGLPFPIGLHDTMLRVQGNAAHELNLVLYKRWIDAVLYEQSPPKANFIYTPYSGTYNEGTTLCQVAMTIDHRPDPPYGFAKLGDRTLLRTLLNAVENAQQYIYIEDQYFREPGIISAINDAAGRGVKVIIVLPRYIWDPSYWSPSEVIAAGLPGFLENGDYIIIPFAKLIATPLLTNAQNVGVYYLVVKEEDIYIHSKLMIVDDIFVSCGSANLDPRGLGKLLSDTSVNRSGLVISNECNLFCFDTRVADQGVRTLARNFRIRLWAEHIFTRQILPETEVALSPYFNSLVDPLEAIERYWKVPSGRIRRLQITP